MNKMNYYDIVKNSQGSEATMWEGVRLVDEFVKSVAKENPEMAEKFLKEVYVAMNGESFCEKLARNVVSEMWHKDKGNIIKGELVSPSDSQAVLDGMSDEQKKTLYWDAYVAANATMHDLAGTTLDAEMKMDVSKAFWFHDDDMDGMNKVFWYFFK